MSMSTPYIYIKNYIRFTLTYYNIYLYSKWYYRHRCGTSLEPHLFDVASIEPHGIHTPVRTMYPPTIKKPCLGSPHLIFYINLFPTMDSWTVVMMVVALIFVPGTGVGGSPGWIYILVYTLLVASRLEVGWIPVRGKSIWVLPATSAARLLCVVPQKHRAHTATSCFFAKLRYHVCVTRRKHDLPFFYHYR